MPCSSEGGLSHLVTVPPVLKLAQVPLQSLILGRLAAVCVGSGNKTTSLPSGDTEDKRIERHSGAA